MSHDVEHGDRGAGSGAFLAGLLMGAAVGAGLALLFAPKKGSELRGQIAETARRTRESARDAYKKASDAAGAATSRAIGEVERAFHDVTGAVRGPKG